MTEYESQPTWLKKYTDDIYSPVNPQSLPIEPSLATELIAWQRAYNGTLDRKDPRRSGFATREQEEAFAEHGRRLWRKLILVLGHSFDIEFFDPITNEVLTPDQAIFDQSV